MGQSGLWGRKVWNMEEAGPVLLLLLFLMLLVVVFGCVNYELLLCLLLRLQGQAWIRIQH